MPRVMILVSACLLGQKVRYDGDHQAMQSDRLSRWIEEGRVVAICPEMAGGLPTPRPAAEIVGGSGGEVLQGIARVRTSAGVDVSDAFVAGAEKALLLVRQHGIRLAILKERSPSCGSRQTYDGTFTGSRRGGEGVTAALLRAYGVEVFSEAELDLVEARLRCLRG